MSYRKRELKVGDIFIHRERHNGKLPRKNKKDWKKKHTKEFRICAVCKTPTFTSLTVEPEIKMVTFLSINHFFKCKIDFNNQYGSAISSGTQEFVFAGTYEELKQIISDNLNQQL